MSDDRFDIRDGERPIGDKVVTVMGLSNALGVATQVLRGDPGIHHVRLEPELRGPKIKPMMVFRPKRGADVPGRLDPRSGEEREEWPR